MLFVCHGLLVPSQISARGGKGIKWRGLVYVNIFLFDVTERCYRYLISLGKERAVDMRDGMGKNLSPDDRWGARVCTYICSKKLYLALWWLTCLSLRFVLFRNQINICVKLQPPLSSRFHLHQI